MQWPLDEAKENPLRSSVANSVSIYLTGSAEGSLVMRSSKRKRERPSLRTGKGHHAYKTSWKTERKKKHLVLELTARYEQTKYTHANSSLLFFHEFFIIIIIIWRVHMLNISFTGIIFFQSQATFISDPDDFNECQRLYRSRNEVILYARYLIASLLEQDPNWNYLAWLANLLADVFWGEKYKCRCYLNSDWLKE